MAVTSMANSSVSNFNKSNKISGPKLPIAFNYLVIGGGGGGGGGSDWNAGGGAGGYICSVTGENSGRGDSAQNKLFFNETGSFTVTIGAGGAIGSDGSASRLDSVISVGGGRGGRDAGGTQINGFLGGSGGGGSANFGSGGQGIIGQGFAGAQGGSSSVGGGGGGGGAASGSTGGVGVSSSITGSAVTRAVGGTGAGLATNGAANTGNGARTNGRSSSARGGSGFVVIKYSDIITLTIGGGLTSSTSSAGGFKTTTFTAGTGTVSF